MSLTSPSGEFVPRVESPRRQSHELVLPVTLAAPEQVPRLGRRHMVDDLWSTVVYQKELISVLNQQ